VEKDLLAFHEKNKEMEVTDWNSEYRELDEVSNWAETVDYDASELPYRFHLSAAI
jgi:uncharacterized protein YbgA (DUF1722 family)